MQRLGLGLERGQLLLDHVHEDQPCLVVLGALHRHAIPALLGQRLLGHVFGDFHPLDFHADILHESGIGAIFLDEQLLHIAHTLPNDQAEALAPRQLVQQLQRHLGVAPGEFQAAGDLVVENARLVTLHRKGDRVGERDRVDAVRVAVEVHLDDRQRIEHADVGASPGDRLVLRPIDQHHVALVRSRLQVEMIHTVRARQRAAIPAAIRNALGVQAAPNGCVQLLGFGV